ncbi:MAG: galactosyltransferase-related protein [Pseudomonadota bacterium]|nr:galactosyltransferase-related protein [Pseudomonadota bacterium]
MLKLFNTLPSRARCAAPPPVSGPLGGFDKPEVPGISLVTANKNRTENMLPALVSWIARPEIDEIVIVDWDCDEPLSEVLAAKGISDPRLRVVRAVQAEVWHGPQAFNTAMRLARYDKIIRIDGDIVVKPDFFHRNRLPPNSFVAGNFAMVEKSQVHINGTVLMHRAALARCGGQNEYTIGYGWEDDDLYNRFMRHRWRRIDLIPETVHHLPHDDSTRVAPPAADTTRALYMSWPRFTIRRNRFVIEQMPAWDADSPMQPFDHVVAPDGTETLVRTGPSPSQVPAPIVDRMTNMALLFFLARRKGRKVNDLDDIRLSRLLDLPERDISAQVIEDALAEQLADGGPLLSGEIAQRIGG